MDTKKIIEQWLQIAEKDWLACQHLYDSKDYPQCLFWGHLVLEKILKALVVKKTNTQAPFSHDLVLLAKKAELELSQEDKDSLNEISTFNQFARYDNEMLGFVQKCTPEYTEDHFSTINKLYLWLKEFFQSNN